MDTEFEIEKWMAYALIFISIVFIAIYGEKNFKKIVEKINGEYL